MREVCQKTLISIQAHSNPNSAMIVLIQLCPRMPTDYAILCIRASEMCVTSISGVCEVKCSTHYVITRNSNSQLST